MQVFLLIGEIALLIFIFTEQQKKADYAAVEEEEDDWTKETKAKAK